MKLMRLKPIKKQGQEEMVGFVLIVVMLIVMGTVFLFMVKPRTVVREDYQTQNMLVSIMDSTENGKTIGDMIEECVHDNMNCGDMENATKKRLDSSLENGRLVLNRTLKGYNLIMSIQDNPPKINISKGIVSGNTLRASIAPIQDIDVVLRFYY